MVSGEVVPVFANSGSLLDMGRTSQAVRQIRAALPKEAAPTEGTPAVIKKLDFHVFDLLFLAILLPAFLAPW